MNSFFIRLTLRWLTPVGFCFLLMVLLNRIQVNLLPKLLIPLFFGVFLHSRAANVLIRYEYKLRQGMVTQSSAGFAFRYLLWFLAAPALGILADYIDWNYRLFIPTASALITTGLVYLIACRRTYHHVKSPDSLHLRGRQILDYATAHRKAKSLGYEAPGLRFGGLMIPIERALQHFLIVGSSGSGKTMTIHTLLPGIVAHMQKRSSCQTVVFDAKLDVIPVLSAYSKNGFPICDLHPGREGAFAWDIARDIRSARDAELAALLLFPGDPRSSSEQEFFKEAPRTLAEELIRALQQVAPENWTLRDLYILMTTPSLCEQMLRHLPDSPIQVDELIRDFYGGDPRTEANLRITIRSKFRKFRHIATAFHAAAEAGRKISLREWSKTGKGFLVLGADKLEDASLNTLNRLIMTVLGKAWLENPRSYSEPEHFLLLDEVQTAGRLDLLSKLMTEGREKGVSVVLGFQDIGSIRRLYGNDDTSAIFGQCGLKAFLRMEGETTADWASRMVGECEVIEYTRGESTSQSRDGGSTTTSRSQQIVRKPAVLPSQFMSIPVTSPENGLTGYYGVNEIGFWKYTMDTNEFPPRTQGIPPAIIDDADPRFRTLPSFTDNDFARLMIQPMTDSVLEGDVEPEIPPRKAAKPATVTPPASAPSPRPNPLKNVKRVELENEDD